ncbi:hypothetical protein B7494_g3444 [Chlorociboria aeruginascens]|nr:hypothetical protein B7494_g3444 [Chlorociboria aeruginascens]
MNDLVKLPNINKMVRQKDVLGRVYKFKSNSECLGLGIPIIVLLDKSSADSFYLDVEDGADDVPISPTPKKGYAIQLQLRNYLEWYRGDTGRFIPSMPKYSCLKIDSYGEVPIQIKTALEQHLRDSPVHAPSFDCEDCDRCFDSAEALQQHLRNAPAHAPSFDCKTCDRSFGNDKALKQHLRDSPIHQQDTETPLDVFFHSFPTFDYDPFLPPATSYANLRKHEKWRRGDAESDDAWNRYQDALQSELQMWYGAENDLIAWHALCRAIGIKPLPKTCEQCKEIVRRTHINIIDLIEWGRSNRKDKVRTFNKVAELQAYTKETNKIFNNRSDQEGGNGVLRHLLRKIF